MTSSDRQTDKIDVSYVAHLARLHLAEDEVPRFQKQLDQIVAYVRTINELDVEGIEPTSHAYSVNNVFRKDETKPGLDREVVLKNAPLQAHGQFSVPKIVE